MLTLIIAALISLGLVDSADHFNSLSAEEQSSLTEIVIEDIETN